MGGWLSESREVLLGLIGSTLQFVAGLLAGADDAAVRRGLVGRRRLEARLARLQAVVALIQALGRRRP